ncbi:MAG: hypothetical protein ACYC4D_06890 [Thermoleophilia bacterium]
MDAQMLSQPLKVRRKSALKIGHEVFIADQSDNVLLWIKQKGFKLKETIHVYSDPSKAEERLSIQARKVMDFNAAFDVTDSQTGEKIGGMRRKGWSSMIQDEWQILDVDDNQIGSIHEDTKLMALLRRFLTALIPQNYEFKVNGETVAQLKQHFNPFLFKGEFQMEPQGSEKLDPRLATAGIVLLMIMEGRQG